VFSYFLPAASSFAHEIDDLFTIITLVVGFWFILTEAAFFWLMVRFQYKEGRKAVYMTGEVHHDSRWVHYPHYVVIACDVVLIVASIMVWNKIKIDQPENPDARIRVIGQQWAWTFVQPGKDGQLDTEDDIITIDELHIQEGLTYVFELEAKDVLHSFFIPVFRLKQDAVPGRIITGWFQATKTGEYDITCAEMCGIGHGIMGARLFIEDQATHQFWMNQNTPAPKNKAQAANELWMNQSNSSTIVSNP
jgi:cytochrome c oxidase subunit II